MNKVKGWIANLTDIGLALIALAIVVQIIFGTQNLTFVSANFLGNLTGLISQLGNAGLVGLAVLGIIAWLFSNRKP